MSNSVFYHAMLNRDRMVHVVEADPEMAEQLAILFRLEGFQTIVSNGLDAFFSAIERRRPDVVVSSLTLGSDSGLTVLRRVRAMRGGAPVFLLAEACQTLDAVAAMKGGATDVLLKPVDTERLIGAVREALRHDIHLGPLESGKRNVEIRGFSQLTPREREVLELISNGQSNKEAGRELGISPRTVEVHRARVMEKLGARNTADLMRIVLTR